MNVNNENVDTYPLPQALAVPIDQGHITEVPSPSY